MQSRQPPNKLSDPLQVGGFGGVVYEKPASYYSETARGGKVRTSLANDISHSELGSRKSGTLPKKSQEKVSNQSQAHYLQGRVDLCLLGTFSEIAWESTINGFLGLEQSKRYWLPWGNRTYGIKRLLRQLLNNRLWDAEEKGDYIIYKALKSEDSIKFFHYRSKAQAGQQRNSACILSRYGIDIIILAKVPIPPSRNTGHALLRSSSECWFGIQNYMLFDRLDFSDFDIVDLGSGKAHSFHFKDDSWVLYKDIAVVKHFSHKVVGHCRCPQCR